MEKIKVSAQKVRDCFTKSDYNKMKKHLGFCNMRELDYILRCSENHDRYFALITYIEAHVKKNIPIK